MLNTRQFSFAVAAVFGLFFVSSSSLAVGSSCDKPRNDFDSLYCLSKVYQQSDIDLNSAFSRLREKLNEAGRDSLRSGQLIWLRNRDQGCSKHEDTGFYVNLACSTQMTIMRTQFLQSRYRECISAGCMNSRLGSD